MCLQETWEQPATRSSLLAQFGVAQQQAPLQVPNEIWTYLQGKVLVTALLSMTVASGTTAVFAATTAGRGVVYAIMAMAHTQAALQRDGHHASSHQAAERKSSTCPGLPEAQQVAAKYALSTSRNGDAVQAMCVLHRGTFVGTTPAGASVSSQQIFGYGEIEKLLAHAQFLVTHDKANAKLTDSDARSYLALASRAVERLTWKHA